MIQFNNTKENCREIIKNLVPDDATEVEIDDLTTELKKEIGSRLCGAGAETKETYQQSVGSFVILQAATTEAERSLFDSILQMLEDEITKRIEGQCWLEEHEENIARIDSD